MDTVIEQNRIIQAFDGWKVELSDPTETDPENIMYVLKQYNEIGTCTQMFSGWECANITKDEVLPYHEDWKFLMPVLEKITTLGYQIEINTNFSYYTSIEKTGSKLPFLGHINSVKPTLIESIHESVYLFITKYNKKIYKAQLDNFRKIGNSSILHTLNKENNHGNTDTNNY